MANSSCREPTSRRKRPRDTMNRQPTIRIASALLALGLVFAACGDDAETQEVPPTDTPAVSDPLPTTGDAGETMLAGTGPGISVEEAIAYDGTEPVLVNGFVFVFADGRVVISDAMAESFPPQPAGVQLDVQGLDLMQIPLTEGPADMEIEIIQWTDQQVQLIGSVVDGVFVGNSVASA